MTKIALQILLSGRVQGVGFRYYARQYAGALGINGYVKNLYDGRVEVVAEGEKELVDRFIAALRRGPSFGNVEHVEIKSLPYENSYSTFSVEY